MARKSGLGRGLAALLGENADEADAVVANTATGPGSSDLAVGAVEAGTRSGAVGSPASWSAASSSNPRGVIDIPVMDAVALDELVSSIAAVGIVQPIIVRDTEQGYELIAGERRWRAAQKAGYTVVPAIVRKASDVESLELALIENVVRQQLNPVDEAYALKVLLEDLGVTPSPTR
jgi:ParB family chromosome partitioning protein